MSEPAIEVIRAMFQAFNSEDIARMLALTHPDFEVAVPPTLSAEPDVYRGLDGMRRYWETFQEAMEQIRFQPGRVAETDHGMLVEMHLTARGRQTGIPVEQRVIGIWEIRDGKAFHIRVFPSMRDALDELGVDEVPEGTDWSEVG
jgi:ketosteroid isomerase-like protein